MFHANIIQFGVDQLHDSPGDHQSLFIHWSICVYNLALLISQVGWELVPINSLYLIAGVTILVIASLSAIVLLSTSLRLAQQKQQWFLKDSARLNPYKLVYRVTKFARQHKVPIRRSAFTYCEDDMPSGLDLGKDKYGGPFTTEQVEDVKAFYGILKVLFALGLTFALDIALYPAALYYFAEYISYRHYNSSAQTLENFHEKNLKTFLMHSDILSSLGTVFVPIYIVGVWPFTKKLSILKRIGLGIIFRLILAFSTLIMDIAVHVTNRQVENCMLKFSMHDNIYYLVSLFFQIQKSLDSISKLLISVALCEFICAQSPHSMKGLLIGLSFAIRGLFELISAAVLVPFIYFRQAVPTCGMEYFIINLIISVAALVVFICVAKQYKLRERDEPCHVQRYVEEYYSKLQHERYFDYD